MSNTKLNAEYIVVTNFSKKTQVVTGWSVGDTSGHRYVFLRFSLKAGKNVKLHTGKGKNTATDLYWGQENYVWNNTRDTATLRNVKKAAVDTCSWKSNAKGQAAC